VQFIQPKLAIPKRFPRLFMPLNLLIIPVNQNCITHIIIDAYFYRTKNNSMKKQLLVAVLLLFSFQLFAQVTITGKVTDAITGTPLSGTTITIKSSGKKVLAGADGSFTIQAATGDVLVFTNVGHKDFTITVGDQQTLDR
jgi:hypothetical protein